MKTEIDTIEEAEEFVKSLQSEDKWAIVVDQSATGKYIVQWLEHKKYTDHTGVERFDEVWTTIDGDLKLVQDLEPEHARNIVRMFLRQQRAIAELMANYLPGGHVESAEDTEERVLH